MVNLYKTLLLLSLLLGFVAVSNHYDEITKWWKRQSAKGIVYQDFEELTDYKGFSNEMGSLLEDSHKKEFGISSYRKDKDIVIVFERFLYYNDDHPIWELLDTIRIKEQKHEEWYAEHGLECHHNSDTLNQYVYIVKSGVRADTFKPVFCWRIDFENKKLTPYSTDSITCITEYVD